jgi:hypothetical protein
MFPLTHKSQVYLHINYPIISAIINQKHFIEKYPEKCPFFHKYIILALCPLSGGEKQGGRSLQQYVYKKT